MLPNISALKDLQVTNTQTNEVIAYYERLLEANNIEVEPNAIDQIDRLIVHGEKKTTGTLNFNYGLCVFWCVVIFFAIQVNKRTVVYPIVNIEKQLKDIIGRIKNNNGDLTLRINTKSQDEIGMLAEGINLFIEELQSIISSIKKNTDDINESTENIYNNINQASDRVQNVVAVTQELSAGIEETTATLEQLSTSNNQILDNVKVMTDETATKSSEMLDVKMKAESLEEETKENKKKADDVISSISNMLKVAIEESKSIEKVNGLTDEILAIANQTNLLALNASIEAARAGEFGRGFAVVATEIGKLAQNSKMAASNIQETNQQVINAANKLITSSSKMLDVMNTSVIEDYNTFVSTAKEYKEDASYMNEILQEISSQSNEIKDTMVAMNEGLNSITIAMNESSNGVVSVAEDTTGLSEDMSVIQKDVALTEALSKDLKRQVSKFKKTSVGDNNELLRD